MTDLEMNRFRADLTRAAATAGIDAAELALDQTAKVTVDNTWGDKIGMYFEGKHAKRAAEYFFKWYAKNVDCRSYTAQNVLSAPMPFQRVVTKHVNGYEITNHIDPAAQKFDLGAEYSQTRHEGFVVPFVYFPCE